MMTQNAEQDTLPILIAFPLYQRMVLSNFDWKHFDFTKTQLLIFLALLANSTMNMSQIATYISSSKEQATRAVAPLVEKGYVERVPDESNRTRVLVRLTDAGHAFLQQQKAHFKEKFAKKYELLSFQEQSELKSAIETTIRLLKKMK